MKTLVRALLAVGLSATLYGCRERPPYVVKTLPSGREVRILGVGRTFSAQDKVWAIELKYETDLPIENPAGVRSEVDDIWSEFRIDADRSGLRLAAITANEPPRGRFITTNRSYGFVFAKGEDGNWRESSAPPNDELQRTRPAQAMEPRR